MIKPGVELDRAIAKAIGLTRAVVEGPPRRLVELYEVIPPMVAVEVDADDELFTDAMIPNYSTDLNLAFSAAEQAGLFNIYAVMKLGDTWVVQEDNDGEIVEGATPALAVCAGILKLQEEMASHGP